MATIFDSLMWVIMVLDRYNSHRKRCPKVAMYCLLSNGPTTIVMHYITAYKLELPYLTQCPTVHEKPRTVPGIYQTIRYFQNTMENPLVLTENLTIKHLLVGETFNPLRSIVHWLGFKNFLHAKFQFPPRFGISDVKL